MIPQAAVLPEQADPHQRLAALEAENAALRAEAAELRRLLDATPQAPWTADAEGRLTGFTQRWLELTGLTSAEALGDGWLQASCPDDVVPMTAAWRHAVRTGEPFDREYRIGLAGGGHRWLRSRAEPWRDEQGRIVRWYGTTENIDAYRRAEEERRQQEAELARERDRLVELFAQASAFIAVLRGPQHVFERVNPAYYQLVGHRQLEGKPLLEALPELRGQGFDQLLTRVLETGEPYQGTGIAVQLHRTPEAAPEQRYVDFVYAPLTEASGGRSGVVAIGYDVTERVRAEQALAAERARLQAVLDHAPVGITLAEAPSGRLIMGNRQMDEIFRRPLIASADIEAYREWRVWREDGTLLEPHEYPLAQALTAGTVASGCFRCERGDGTLAWLQCNAAPVRDGAGQITGAVIVIQDVDAERQAGTALRASEEQLRLALEAGGLGAWDYDAAHDAVYWDLGTRQAFGVGPDEPICYERVVRDIVHPADRERVDSAAQRALAEGDGGRYDVEHRVLHPDGTVRWLCVNGRVALTEKAGEGRTVRLFGTVQDVTQRKALEESLEAERRLLRAIVDRLPVGVMVTDAQGAATLVNQALQDIWRGQQPLDGLDSYRRYLAWDAATGQAIEPHDWPVSRALASGLPQGPDEYRIRRFDGTDGYLTAMAAPLRDAAGALIGGVAVGQDSTERRRSEEALRRSNEELERFAFTASHDLQEPLRMVASYTQLLARRYRGQLDAPADEYLSFVLQGTELMGRLIRDLLLYARCSSGEELERRPVDANVPLQLALAVLQSRIEESRASLSWDRLPMVTAAEGLLAQVFQNLLSNALKYTRPGVAPEVHIGAERQGAEWVFTVRDNGPGIPPAHRQRVFGLFTRLHGREVSGTGIGLATVQRIVARHGGRVWVEGEPGQGSSFFFTLPADSAGEKKRR